jgi:hypothetical protein
MPDLRKIKVPEGELRVEIDDPLNRTIDKPSGAIHGWLATRDTELPETIDFRIAGTALPHEIVKREDVEQAMPDHNVMGFVFWYDLATCLPNIEDNRLLVLLTLPGYDPYRMSVKIDEKALAECLENAGDV